MHDAELDTLLAPLAGDAPCGPSLLYDAVFDAIREARREDDASLPQGVWTAPLKKPDWPAVSRLCTQVLATRSKDVQVAAWLGEAWIAQHGAAGGLRATRLLQGLCERYWEDLHPLPRGGDIEFRTMPLEWADANWAAALHGRVVLVGVRDGGGHTLRAWQEALVADNEARKLDHAPVQADARSSTIRESAADMPAALLRQATKTIADWTSAVDTLQVLLKQRLDHQAPRLGKLRKMLDAGAQLMEQCLRLHPGALETHLPEGSRAAQVEDENVVMSSEPDLASTQSFRSREDAYRTLGAIASYLATVEPHSPVPALIRRAVVWGGMSFEALMKELLQNSAGLQELIESKQG